MEEEENNQNKESYILQIENMLTPDRFREDIEKYVYKFESSYMDAILHYVKEHSIEVEMIPALLKGNPKIKSNVQEEAENLHFLERTDRLPI